MKPKSIYILEKSEIKVVVKILNYLTIIIYSVLNSSEIHFSDNIYLITERENGEYNFELLLLDNHKKMFVLVNTDYTCHSNSL